MDDAIEIRPAEGVVVAGGKIIPLSRRELGLLQALAARADRVVSRDDLYRIVWGSQLRPGDRSIDVYVHKLRAKLEEAVPERRFIHTHVGFGYRLSAGTFTSLSHRSDRAVTR
jgi:DNA-binding response OmpR family regulator